MMRVLVTGAEGFIGKNLAARLTTMEGLEVSSFDLGDQPEALETLAARADFVVHLAGVNRPKDPAEFESGNRGLTERLVEALIATGGRASLLVSSSIQAGLDNPYGKSKLGAEAAARGYSEVTGASVFLFRLPNVYGKWCRPNYNSVIATWCHNSANGLPLQISDPSTELNLVYVDDVCEAFVSAIQGKLSPAVDGFCRIAKEERRNLGEIARMLETFAASRKSLVMPSLEGEFARRLYATWLSYLSEDEFAYPLEMRKDDRGWLAEFIKSSSFGQVFVSRTKPGITRGNHWHHTKVEKFLVVSGEALVSLRRIGGIERLEYPVSGEELKVVDIPVGYTHSIANIGQTDLLTIFWADEIFDPAAPDTIILEV
jgi:UDP-2-acetamido-2,6-beta-L-arabino-hexul-4-ose reductase